jgi:hypothetical protein
MNESSQSTGDHHRRFSFRDKVRFHSFARFLQPTLIIAAVILGAANSYYLWNFDENYVYIVDKLFEHDSKLTQGHVDALTFGTESLQRDMDLQGDIFAVIDSLMQRSPQEAQVAELALLRRDVDTLGQDIDRLNAVIMDDPARAIEITSLSDDIEALRLRHETEFNLIQGQLDRINSTILVFLGAVAFGYLASLVASARGQRPTSQ